MSLIDCYMVFEKDPAKKSKHTMIASSGHYDALQRCGKRSAAPVIYLTPTPDAVHAMRERKPALALVGPGSTYLSGVYLPDVERPGCGFGDVHGTMDAILIIAGEGRFELIVCKGKKAVASQIWSLFADADPDLMDELSDHRRRAMAEAKEQGPGGAA